MQDFKSKSLFAFGKIYIERVETTILLSLNKLEEKRNAKAAIAEINTLLDFQSRNQHMQEA